MIDKIINKSKIDLEIKKSKTPLERLEALIKPKNITNMYQELKRDEKSSNYNFICEIKKASPSKGIIKEDFNPLDIAKIYEKCGAKCISVLTEENYFLGSLDYLKEASQNVKTPLLRKDFIFDKYQIIEAYLNNASMILLIVKMLTKEELNELISFAKKLNLYVLVEIHNKEELDIALDTDAKIIGINSRNLSDFSMNMNLCEELFAYIPNDKIIIAESGIDNKQTLASYDKLGVDAYLIGEYFMRQTNMQSHISNFIKR